MQDRKLWTTIAAPLLLMLLTSAIANAQQTTMPPRTQDRPLQDRIDSMERAQRDEWQKPDQVLGYRIESPNPQASHAQA